MRSLRVRVDGRGDSRLDSLPLPFAYTGPSAVASDQLPEGVTHPTGGSVLAVRHAEGSTSPTATARRIELVVSGTLEVRTPSSRAVLGPGDALMIDDLTSSGGTLRYADECRTLQVAVPDSWTPAGVVPPTVTPSDGRRQRRVSLSEMYVADGLAYFRDFGRLFGPTDDDQLVEQPLDAAKFIVFSHGHDGDWHVDKTTNLVFVASGELELQVSGGDQPIERYAPGDICLVQDLVGKGHILRARGETRIVALTVPDEHRWRVS